MRKKYGTYIHSPAQDTYGEGMSRGGNCQRRERSGKPRGKWGAGHVLDACGRKRFRRTGGQDPVLHRSETVMGDLARSLSCVRTKARLEWVKEQKRRAKWKAQMSSVLFSFVLRVHLLGCHLQFFFFFKNLVKSIHLFEENQT